MFNFYGSKRRIAECYPEPKFDLIVEPFCGSAAYSLFHKRWQKQVFLYDADHRIITVWKYLIGASASDILNLPVFGPGTNVDSFNLSQAEKWFLGYMISAATRNPKKTATEKTNWNERKRKQIAESLYKVHHWQAECLDFREIPNREATWFIDPPYMEKGKWYDKRLKEEEYPELAKSVRGWSGQKIVCESSEATWLPFKPLVSVKGQSNNRMIEGIFLDSSA